LVIWERKNLPTERNKPYNTKIIEVALSDVGYQSGRKRFSLAVILSEKINP
jgi:hypothetical protein